MYFVCHKKGHLKAPSKCPKLLGQMLSQCANVIDYTRAYFMLVYDIHSVSPLVPELRAQHDRDPAELGHGAQPPRGRGHRVRFKRQ